MITENHTDLVIDVFVLIIVNNMRRIDCIDVLAVAIQTGGKYEKKRPYYDVDG